MKRRYFCVLLCFIIAGTLFVGCKNTTMNNDQAVINEVFELGPNDVEMEFSWALWYYGVEDIMTYFDIIVLGTVGGLLEEYVNWPGQMPLPGSDYSFHIEQVLFDRYDRDLGSEIVITNVGGIYEGAWWGSPDYPPFWDGEQMILFLKWKETGRGGYRSHPQGRFIVRDEQVYTIKLRSPQATAVLPQYHEVPLNQFLDEINAAAEVIKQFTQYRVGAEDVNLDYFENWRASLYSIEDLIERSDLVLRGTATGAGRTFDRQADNPAKVGPEPVTNYSIVVEEIIYNRNARDIGDSINVQNPGGVLDGERYISIFTVPFDEGETVLLFLEEADKDNVYQFHPRGRFIVHGDRVYTTLIKASQPTNLILTRYHGVPIDEFLEEIKEELAATEEK